MRVSMLSNCEKKFLLAAFLEKSRLDGRDLNEYRHLEIQFGADLGSCFVSLGETKVLAQTTVEIDVPRAVRPNEGLFYINLEFGPMANQGIEGSQRNNTAVHINRFLEKCFKESRCLDLESLCIISEEQVWVVRVCITVLNNDGNLMTCCSVAALGALAHFKLPVVSIEENETVIHSVKERHPIPVSLHHYPVAVTYAICNNGETMLADPTEIEEKVSEAELVFGMNSYREICSLHFTGKAVINKASVMMRAFQAAQCATEIVETIKSELQMDAEKRKLEKNEGEGLVSCINSDRILAASQDRSSLRLTMIDGKNIMEQDGEEPLESDNESQNRADLLKNLDDSSSSVMKVAELTSFGTAWEPSGGKSTWIDDDEEEEESSSDDDGSSTSDVEITGTITDADRIVDNIVLSGESEEEETLTLKGCDIQDS